MIYANDKVFVANMKEKTILVLNPETYAIESQINVTLDPSYMIYDGANSLWVPCNGGFCPDCELPVLYQINTQTLSIEKNLPLTYQTLATYNAGVVPSNIYFN